MSVTSLLEAYSFSELLELNDLTEEEAVEYLVAHGLMRIPDVTPLEFEP